MIHNWSFRVASAAFALLLVVMLASCSSSNSPAPVVPRTGTIAQADLDKATTPIIAGVVGDSFNVFLTIPKPPDSQTTFRRLRDIFSNIGKTTAITEGTVMVRAAYNDAAGSSVHDRNNLFATMVMIKREPGYFKDGGDWEYVFIPFKSADTAAHRYGILPADSLALANNSIDSTKTGVRGKLFTRCAHCHAAAHDNGFLFER
jgi:hypothetical protein